MIVCDIANVNGSLSGWEKIDDFGIGCYCKSLGTSVEHQCCFDADGNFGEKNCINDLSSKNHICNKYEGIVKNEQLQPMLPSCPYGGGRPCCFNDQPDFDPNLPCKPSCSPTYSQFTAADGIRYSGGRPRG